MGSGQLGQWAHTFLILGMMLGGGTFGIVRELSQLVDEHLWLPFAAAGLVVTLTSESSERRGIKPDAMSCLQLYFLLFGAAGLVLADSPSRHFFAVAYLISEHPGAGSHTRFVRAATGSRKLGFVVGCLPLVGTCHTCVQGHRRMHHRFGSVGCCWMLTGSRGACMWADRRHLSVRSVRVAVR